MRRLYRLIRLGAILAALAVSPDKSASAQTTPAIGAAALPRFDVASIRPSPSTPVGAVGLRISQTEARFTWIPLRTYIANAFGVPEERIDGPAWLASAHFDIVAKMPEDPAQNDLQEHVPAMLRALLEERFHLRTHRARREFTVFGLEVSPRGPALTRAPDDSSSPGPFSVLIGPSGGRKVTTYSDGASLALGDNGLEARRMSMSRLAGALTPFAGRPVVDMTNLEGRFDVKFTLEPEDFLALMRRSVAAAGFAIPQEDAQRFETASTVALPEALEKIGLLLRTRRASLDVLVVDSVDRRPTDN
jgi:uncharacterized protein (TIGR03435 family)